MKVLDYLSRTSIQAIEIRSLIQQAYTQNEEDYRKAGFIRKYGLWTGKFNRVLIEDEEIQDLIFNEFHVSPTGGHRGAKN